MSAIGYFFIVGIIALTIAAKFVWPELLGTVSVLTYGRLRPLHVNGMLFGWLLAADMGLTYYFVPRLCGVKLWSEKLGVATAALWNVIILGAVVSLLAGWNQGLEYAELPLPLDILVVVAWIMYGTNIFGTIATRKYPQMYVSLWYTMGTILWTAFVYLTGNFAVLLTTGVNQANLNWMYVHNAVGLIFTPVGLAIAYYFIPKSSNTPLYSHKLSMIGFWALAFVYVWTGAHHMLHGPISQWLQTIAITFSVMLLIPVWAVVYNFFATMQGRMAAVARKRAAEVPDVGHRILPAHLLPGADAQPAQRERDRVEDGLDSRPRPHGRAGGLFVLRHRGHILHRAAHVAHPAVQRRPGELELLVPDDRRAGVLRHVVAGRLLARLAVEQRRASRSSTPWWRSSRSGPVRFFSGILMFCGIVAFAYNIMATVIGRKEYAQ